MKQYKSIIINTVDKPLLDLNGLPYEDDVLVIDIARAKTPGSIKRILEQHLESFLEVKDLNILTDKRCYYSGYTGLHPILSIEDQHIRTVFSYLNRLINDDITHFNVNIIGTRNTNNGNPSSRTKTSLRICSYFSSFRNLYFIKDKNKRAEVRKHEHEFTAYSQSYFHPFCNENTILNYIYKKLAIKISYDIVFDFDLSEELTNRIKYIVEQLGVLGTRLIMNGKVIARAVRTEAYQHGYGKRAILIANVDILNELGKPKYGSGLSNTTSFSQLVYEKNNPDFFNVLRDILTSNTYNRAVICSDGIESTELAKLKTALSYLLGYSSGIQIIDYEGSKGGDIEIEQTFGVKEPGHLKAKSCNYPMALSSWVHSRQVEVSKAQDE